MPRWLLKGCIVSASVLVSCPAAAQDAQQLFNFFLDQAGQELSRQQQIEQQRQQQVYDLFVANWYGCGAGDIVACEQALTYPQLSASDRRMLKKQRAALLEAQRQSVAQQEEQERQAAREEETRQEAARAAEVKRQEDAARAKQARLERERADELARQQAEVERLQQERLAEETRLKEMRTFADLREACRAYDTHACTMAYNSPFATADDRNDFATWRRTAEELEAYLTACAADRSAAACDAALASPALKPARRPEVAGWRAEASPSRIAMASVTRQASAVLSSVANLPASTQITGAVAALLGAALVLLMRQRTVPVTPAGDAASSSPGWWTRLRSSFLAFGQRLSRSAKSPGPQTDSSTRADARPEPTSPEPVKPMEATEPAPKAQLPVVIAPRDTPGALSAMELALAYISEVKELGMPDYEDKADIKQRLNTLSLAAKQLTRAESCDPDAVLEAEESDGATIKWRLYELKSVALRLEGMTHAEPRKARAALEAATEADPENDVAFYFLGLFHAGERNRAAAIDAFRRAVELNPGNVEFRMELDRAENLSGAEIAGFKMTRAGVKTYNAGIHTLNFFIICRNILVVIWNIFAFVWNTITFPLRLMQRILGFFG